MLIAIFGAGASYDSNPAFSPLQGQSPYRPPLANELFDNREAFSNALQQFPQTQPIIPHLRMRQGNLTVEQVLENFRAEATDYPAGLRQLAAIRFYLNYMLWECMNNWGTVHKGVTNYKTLLDLINRRLAVYRSVCMVTFNYDTMIEDALPVVGVKISTIDDYISDRTYTVIKAHGSVNWAHEVRSPVHELELRQPLSVAHELIERADSLDISDNFFVVPSYPMGKLLTAPTTMLPMFPALAIPVETKKSFECPQNHLEALKLSIGMATKLLIVGWRGTENHFLELLCRIPPGIPAMVVAGGSADSQNVAQHLSNMGVRAKWQVSEGGFTDFVLNRDQVNKFLSN